MAHAVDPTDPWIPLAVGGWPDTAQPLRNPADDARLSDVRRHCDLRGNKYLPGIRDLPGHRDVRKRPDVSE